MIWRCLGCLRGLECIDSGAWNVGYSWRLDGYGVRADCWWRSHRFFKEVFFISVMMPVICDSGGSVKMSLLDMGISSQIIFSLLVCISDCL